MNKQFNNVKTEELKARIEDYLISKGINTKTSFTCLNPAHDDNHPSMSFDRNRNKVHCFSCGCDYDIIDLIKEDYNLTTSEAIKKGLEMFNIKNVQYTHNTHNADKTQYMTKTIDYTNYFNQCKQNISQNTYLEGRGISAETIRRFNIGFDSAFNQGSIKKAVIIPTGKNSFVARNVEDNSADRYRKTGTAQLFNIDICANTDKPVFIVEGEIDALSIAEIGHSAVALGSISQVNKFLNYVKEEQLKNTFLISLDKDKSGQEAQRKLVEGLTALGVKCFEVDITGKYKDANEALQKDRNDFESLVKHACTSQTEKEKQAYSERYASKKVRNFIDGIMESVNTSYIPTGFEKLDNTLDGGLFEGLYFIGAISSLGKTTFTLQIADQIAESGQDVLIFSLEMAENELIAKSISRLTLLNSSNTQNAKTTRGITTYSRYKHYSNEEVELIKTSIKKYAEIAQNIIIQEGRGDIGVKDIRTAVDEHIRITGKKPVVIIDYLQIIAPYNDRATDKQNIDKAVIELKRISRDYKISILAISSLNRDNYTSKISMQAFKESGAIEYSSDVLLGLQFKGQGSDKFDIDDAKRKSNNANTPREIELKILKNRNGRTGDVIDFNYYPLFNYFREV